MASCSGLRLSRSSLIGITIDKRIMGSLPKWRKIAEEIDARAKQADDYEHGEPKKSQTQSRGRRDAERRQEQDHASFAHAHAVETDRQESQESHHGHDDALVTGGDWRADGQSDQPKKGDIGQL